MARGWVQSMSLIITVGLAAHAAGLCLFDLASVSGVLGIKIFASIPTVLLAAFILQHGFRRCTTPISAPNAAESNHTNSNEL